MRKELHKKAVYKRRLKKLAKSYKYRLEMQRKFFKGFGYDIEPPARKEHLDALGLLLLSPNVRLVIKLADNEVGKGLKAREAQES